MFGIFGLLFVRYVQLILLTMEGPPMMIHDYNSIQKYKEEVVANNNQHNHNDNDIVVGKKHVVTNPQGCQRVRALNILVERQRIHQSLLMAQQQQQQEEVSID